MQIMRLEGVSKASTITKLLVNPTTQLSTAVKGVVRFNRIVESKTIAKLLPKNDGDISGYIFTPDGDIMLTPDGNYAETPDHA